MKDEIPRRCTLVTPSDSLPNIFDALRVYSAAGCVVRVVPFGAASTAATVDLTFPAGTFVEPLSVQMVKAAGLSGSPVIHGYQK